MKNKIFKPLFVALLTFAVLAGCEALEDKEVQPPIPWETEKNTALDINTRSTFMGNYKPSKITLSPLPNAPEVTYLNAVINNIIINLFQLMNIICSCAILYFYWKSNINSIFVR